MLTHAPVTTILPVKNLDRAIDFYKNILELLPVGAKEDGKFVFSVGSGFIALIPKAEGTKAEHTAISFEIENMDSSIQLLEKKGVVFEDYDLPVLKTVNHTCVLGAEKTAWFQDTEGNILCIHEVISKKKNFSEAHGVQQSQFSEHISDL